MKLNIAFPANGTQLMREVSAKEEQRFYGKSIGEQFDGQIISEEFAGCIMQIVGGNDFQGVPMVPGHDTIKRIRLLLAKGDIGYRCRRDGVRKRKTVRGSIVSSHTQVMCLVIAQIPEGKEIPGLTDTVKDKSHFLKRASKIRAAFGIPESVKDTQIAEYTLDLIRRVNPEATIKRIKVTGVVSDEERARRAAVRAERAAKKERLAAERVEYEKKYGVTL